MQRERRSLVSLAPLLALTVVGVAAVIAGVFPLTGSPGPEAAQVLAALGGPALWLAGASRGSDRHTGGFGSDLRAQAFLVLLALLLFMGAVTVFGWSAPSCAPGRGYVPFFVLSAPVLMLHSILGLWVGRLTGNRRLATVASVVALVLYAVGVGLDWYLEPSFRLLTHLSVLMEGDLVRGRGVSAGAAAYRLATALLACGLSIVGTAVFPPRKQGGFGGPSSPTLGRKLAGSAVLVASWVIHLQAAAHLAPPRKALHEAYRLEERRGPVVLHADPDAVSSREVEAILAEAHLWLSRVEERLGVRADSDIHIYLHANRREMGRWTGAENVHFALPSNGELHITGTEVPHPTLGHELAHVLGRKLAGGLLGIPTKWGVLPNTGLVEGLAMAVTPELEVELGLTLREQAAALEQAGIAAPLSDLFDEGLSFVRFWRHPPANAYVTAGALVDAVAAATGRDGLAKMYSAGRIAAAFPSDEAAAAFLVGHAESLRQLTLPPEAVPLVGRALTRPSILAETCDDDAGATAQSIRDAARTGDFASAERIARSAEDPLTGPTLQLLARAAELHQDPGNSLRYLAERAESRDTNDQAEQAKRRDELGDALFHANQIEQALAAWAAVQRPPLRPWQRRLVDAKGAMAAAVLQRPRVTELARACLELLTRDPRSDMVAPVARIAGLLSQSLQGNEDGGVEDNRVVAFARYLVMRQMLQRGEVERGLELALTLWSECEFLEEMYVEELRRAIAHAHARRGDFEVARVGFERLADSANLAADRVMLRDRAERCARMATYEMAPGEKMGDRWLLGLPGQAGL
ncbi:MAG: hypothetical protein ACO3JL_06255 [Myxococcota bacterium]